MAFAKPKTKTQTNLPTHELNVAVTLPNGNSVTVGRVGLFTENNKIHRSLAKLSQEQLTALVSNISLSLQEYGANRDTEEEVDFGV